MNFWWRIYGVVLALQMKVTSLILLEKPSLDENPGMNDSALILTLAQHSHFTLSFFFSPTGLREEHLTRLHIILDGRSRLEEPKLPQGYIGNALFHARPISLLGDLLREPFSKTVKRVHEEIKKMDKKYLRSAIDCLEKHPDLDQLVPGEGNPIFSCAANFCIVSLPKDTAYELDFGWGKPFFKRTSHLNEGKGFVGMSLDEEGSFLVFMCLKKTQLSKFRKLFYEFLNVSAL